MDIETVLAAMDLPAGARRNGPVNRSSLLKACIANQGDTYRIRHEIEDITWLANLNTATTGVPPAVEVTRECHYIYVLAVTLRPQARISAVAETLHHVLAWSTVLLIRQNGLQISMSYKNRDPELRRRGFIGAIVSWCPLGDVKSDADFLASLRWGDLPKRDLFHAYHRWYCCVDALKASRLTGEFEVLTDRDQVMDRREKLAEYSSLHYQFAMMRREAESDRRVMGKSDLDAPMARFKEQMASIRESLRRTPTAPPASAERKPEPAPWRRRRRRCRLSD